MLESCDHQMIKNQQRTSTAKLLAEALSEIKREGCLVNSQYAQCPASHAHKLTNRPEKRPLVY